jgi:two-component sensor histidine kinase
MLKLTEKAQRKALRDHGNTAERRIVCALLLFYWIAFQIVYFTYGVLRKPVTKQSTADFLLELLFYILQPSELLICLGGAVICYANYLLVKILRHHPFWFQLGMAVIIMVASTFAFALSTELIMMVMAGALFEPRPLVGLAVICMAPLGLWTLTILSLIYNAEVRERERRLAVLQAQAHEAQVRALRFQINPHFLYNTLNSISALILESRNLDAERMVLALANFFRTTISADPLKDVRLADEIALQKLYLDIEQIRFSDGLTVEIDMPPSLEDAVLPGLILQPLLENALKHGVREPGEMVLLSIVARTEADLLVVEVKDNGPGKSDAAGVGVGLPNVRDRLIARFGIRARLDTHADASGFRVRLSMPLEFAR